MTTSEMSMIRGNSKIKWLPWIVCLTAGLLFFYEFIQTILFNVLAAPISKEFGISADKIGWISSMYFLADAGFIPIAGLLLDRYSTRKLILLAMAFCTLGNFGFAIASSPVEAGAFRFITGIGGSFCFISCMRLASRWFPPNRMALVTGLLVTMAFIGGYVAQTPTASLIQAYGWRNTLLLDAGLGIVCSILIWIVVQDRPQHTIEDIRIERQKLKVIGIAKTLRLVFTNKQNWLGGLFTCFINLPLFLLSGMWGSLYLTQVFHLNRTQASTICGMLLVGAIFGSPFFGWFSDFIAKRKLPLIIGSVLALAALLPILYTTNLSYNELLVLFFSLGFVSSSQVIGYPFVAENNSPLITGSAVGIVSMLTLFGGFVFEPFSGWLLDLHWAHQYHNGIPFYTLADYHRGLGVLTVVYVLAIGIACSVRETHGRIQMEKLQ